MSNCANSTEKLDFSTNKENRVNSGLISFLQNAPFSESLEKSTLRHLNFHSHSNTSYTPQEQQSRKVVAPNFNFDFLFSSLKRRYNNKNKKLSEV